MLHPWRLTALVTCLRTIIDLWSWLFSVAVKPESNIQVKHWSYCGNVAVMLWYAWHNYTDQVIVIYGVIPLGDVTEKTNILR